ncbi:MAG TPA: formate dehydrogenase subunit gamma [Burkholderiaceae bacterium]|nr:formate dehydrogenase subunit gamma [Burkholderiaceae bacterium]
MIRGCLTAGITALALAGVAQAQDIRAQTGMPASAATHSTNGAGYTAPPLPKPDDSQAQRKISQPGNNAPFWRGIRNSGNEPGVIAMPGAEKGVLVQAFTQYPGSSFTTAGEAWRQVRNNWIIPYGGALVIIILVAVLLYYFVRGPMGEREAGTGRVIERFTYFERAAHWSNAVAFVVLALSGIVIAWGQFFLLPWLGHSLFGWLAYGFKTAHNFFGPLFAVSLVIVFLTFLRDNFPGRGDGAWLRRGGGMFGGAEPPSGRFNAGEKLVFWGGVFLLGIFIVSSGLVLDKLIPGFGDVRSDMQIAHMVHSVAAALIIVVFIGHIYIGTIGMRGAYRAMKTGYVEEGWAEEHHRYWYDDIKAGKIPAQRSAPPPPQRTEQPAA